MKDQQLKRVVIKGFKSIKNCDVSLSNINVLIGNNGAGKSNFISMFEMLQNIIEGELQLFVGRAGGANTFMFNGTKNTERIEFEFFFGSNSYKISLNPTNANALVFEKEEFCFNGQSENGKPSNNKGGSESIWDAYYTFVDKKDLDSNIEPIFQIFQKQTQQNQKWRVYHFNDTSRFAHLKQSVKYTNDATLLSDARNIAAYLFRLKNEFPNEYKRIVETVKFIAPYFKDFYLETNMNDDIILRWKQYGCDDIFNANQLSDGTLRFICLATLLLQPTQLQPNTIIIDEPELGLHPYAIALLAEMIKAVANTKQVIISTQSVELLNEFAINDVIVVDRDKEGSHFYRYTEEELTHWLEDYSLGELWKKNIIRGSR